MAYWREHLAPLLGPDPERAQSDAGPIITAALAEVVQAWADSLRQGETKHLLTAWDSADGFELRLTRTGDEDQFAAYALVPGQEATALVLPAQSVQQHLGLERTMRRALLIGVVLTVFLILAGGAGVGYAIWRMAPNLPSLPTDPHELGIRPGTEMYAASGERIYTFNQSRQWVPLKDISPYVVQALIATEDAHFYHHRGIDLTGHRRRDPRQPARGQPLPRRQHLDPTARQAPVLFAGKNL